MTRARVAKLGLGVAVGVAVGVVEFGERREAVFEAATGRMQRTAGQVVEDEVVEADVEPYGGNPRVCR
jgi:hypothetical protein